MQGGSNRILSAKEAAEYLAIKYPTLLARYKEWGLVYYKYGSLVRFRERDLENWVASRRVSP